MSNFSRKKKRNIDKLSNELLKKLTRPDDECNNCTKPLTKDCYMTCPELYQRNKLKNQRLLDQIRNITGDSRIQ